MKNNTRQLSLTALFVALVFLLGLTPLGLIPLGFINVTILCLPVIVGTILLGLKTGLLLGFFFGTASLMSVLGLSMTAPSTLALTLFNANAPMCVAMCYVPRLLVPVAAHCVYRLMSRGEEKCVRALPFAAAAGSLDQHDLLSGHDAGSFTRCAAWTRARSWRSYWARARWAAAARRSWRRCW